MGGGTNAATEAVTVPAASTGSCLATRIDQLPAVPPDLPLASLACRFGLLRRARPLEQILVEEVRGRAQAAQSAARTPRRRLRVSWDGGAAIQESTESVHGARDNQFHCSRVEPLSMRRCSRSPLLDPRHSRSRRLGTLRVPSAPAKPPAWAESPRVLRASLLVCRAVGHRAYG